jgi:hypothetical protein
MRSSGSNQEAAAVSLERGVGIPTEQPGGDVLFPMKELAPFV